MLGNLILPPWATIGLDIIKRAWPVLLVIAVAGGVYFLGRSHGASKWESKYDAAIVERDEASATAEHNYDQWEQCRDAHERQSEAIRNLKRDTADADAAVRAAHRAEVARLERERARAVAEAQGRADALAERVRELSVAEACHEAMLEIATD